MREGHPDHRRHHQGEGRLVLADCTHHTDRVEHRHRDDVTTSCRERRRRQRRGGMEHRGLGGGTTSCGRRERHQAVVHVHHLAALVGQHALGEAGRAAGVHEHDGIGLQAFVGNDRRCRREHVRIARCVGSTRYLGEFAIITANRSPRATPSARRPTMAQATSSKCSRYVWVTPVAASVVPGRSAHRSRSCSIFSCSGDRMMTYRPLGPAPSARSDRRCREWFRGRYHAASHTPLSAVLRTWLSW